MTIKHLVGVVALLLERMSFVKYIVDDKYSNIQHLRLKRCFSVNDGLSDTVRQLLLSFNPYDRTVLNMMLIPF